MRIGFCVAKDFFNGELGLYVKESEDNGKNTRR